jgi:hypothetical protein
MAFECVGNESITYYAEPELRVAEAVKVVWCVCVCVSGKDVPLDDFRFFCQFCLLEIRLPIQDING